MDSNETSEVDIEVAEKFSQELVRTLMKYGLMFEYQHTALALATSLIVHMSVVGGGDKEAFMEIVSIYWDEAVKNLEKQKNAN